MPFTLEDFQTFRQYQAKLKSEAAKVGHSGHFAVYQKCAFGDGATKTVLLVGPKQDKHLEQLLEHSGAKLKARGSCAHGDAGLTLTVEKGSLAPGDVHGLGVNVALSTATETGEDGHAQVPSTPPPSTFQRATPSHTTPQSTVTLGGGEREGIAAFIKQRQDLLEFANTFLQNMEYFRDRAKAAVTQANGLISRADGGEHSESLARAIQGALHTVQELRQAAHDAHEEQGTHVAKERQINPKNFGLTGEVETKVGARVQPLFQKITDVTVKAGAANRETLMELDEAARGLELSLGPAQTGKADLQTLLRYLDGVLESMQRPSGLLDRNYAIDTIMGNLADALQRNVPNDQLERMYNSQRQGLQAKEGIVAETMGQIQALCKAALTRIKLAPHDNPAVVERFEKVKAALSDATAKKRKFTEDYKAWPDLEKRVTDRLGQTT